MPIRSKHATLLLVGDTRLTFWPGILRKKGHPHIRSTTSGPATVAALPPVPDSANLFTTYNNTSQAMVSDARLRLIGRKTSTFAMLFVQNTTGTWGAILRNQTPTPVAGTISLLGMQPSATFTVKWYDTDIGAVVATDSPSADSGGLLSLRLPSSISQNIAAIVTIGTAS